jgi:hypothetical protein
MHVSRIACLLLGGWLGGSLFMTAVATQNFRSVDRTLERAEPEAVEAVNRLGGEDAARTFLRHHVGEQNRFYFAAWEYAQLGLGCALFLILLFGSRQRKRAIAVSLLMLCLVGVMRSSVTPSITALSRELDFAASERETPIRSQFRAWHSAYSVIELTKLGLGLLLAGMLISGNGPRRSARLDSEGEYARSGY